MNAANVTARPQQKTFAEMLRETRTSLRRSARDFADSAGVSVARYGEWEEGVSCPDRAQLNRMVGRDSPLQAYLPRPVEKAAVQAKTALGAALVKANLTVVPSPAKSAEVPPAAIVLAVAAPVAPADPDAQWVAFGAALREERTREKVTQGWIAEEIGVDSSTVSVWESGHRRPIRKHYDALVALLPALAKVKIDPAAMRDIDKPGPAPGTVGQAAQPASPPPPAPTPPAAPAALPMADPLSAIDRVILAYDTLGQSLDFTHTRQAGAYTARLVTADGEVLATGEGTFLSAAAKAMLESLLDGLVQRQESTRKLVEQATTRLQGYMKAVDAIRGAVGGTG